MCVDHFARRRVVLEPGDRRPFEEREWDDALVIVERGEVDLEYRSGARLRFIAGDMLWLTGLPLRSLRNPGAEPAVLPTVSRCVQGASVRL